jgi:hypothetical protein
MVYLSNISPRAQSWTHALAAHVEVKAAVTLCHTCTNRCKCDHVIEEMLKKENEWCKRNFER